MEGLNNLIANCMSGLLWDDPDTGPRLIDFVVPHRDGVTIAAVGWWDPQYNGGSFLSMFQELPQATVKQVGKQRFEVHLRGGDIRMLFAPEDATQIKQAQDHRLVTELRRYEYTEALENATNVLVGKEFIDWVAAYLTRPRVTVQSLQQKKMNQLRKVGTIMLVDGNGTAIDVLVFDQTGETATAGIDTWLEGMERVWTDLPPADRPTLLGFAERLEGQGYADKYLTKPGEIEARGTLAQIASTLLA